MILFENNSGLSVHLGIDRVHRLPDTEDLASEAIVVDVTGLNFRLGITLSGRVRFWLRLCLIILRSGSVFLVVVDYCLCHRDAPLLVGSFLMIFAGRASLVQAGVWLDDSDAILVWVKVVCLAHTHRILLLLLAKPVNLASK